jgi:alanine dehydrogenase
LALATDGAEHAIRDDPALALGVNTWDGTLTNQGVADATGITFSALVA